MCFRFCLKQKKFVESTAYVQHMFNLVILDIDRVNNTRLIITFSNYIFIKLLKI